ncbi:TPA: DUF2617 family protein [Candidatus Poribacteria bacterium]|nr:DUF2617 family protein [Candidatus Poribacteria bacterium]
MLTYQSQNMTDLWFYLLESDSIPGQFHILKQKCLRLPNYQLDLRIIGSSHIISLRTASAQLTECLTCLPIRKIDAPTLVERSIPLNGDDLTIKVGDVHYTVKFHTAWLGEDEYRNRHQLLLNSENEAMLYEFPVHVGKTRFNPLTLLKYSCQPKRVQIRTYHTYPDECGIADTHTHIEILQ